MQFDELFQQVNQQDKWNTESFIDWLLDYTHIFLPEDFITPEDLDKNRELLQLFSAYVRTSSLK